MDERIHEKEIGSMGEEKTGQKGGVAGSGAESMMPGATDEMAERRGTERTEGDIAVEKIERTEGILPWRRQKGRREILLWRRQKG